ncbi:DNA polymerase zeta catalytic subunit isoform X1 [Salvia hispanica]|uniref:DNA polymerase zeta catalytic subunit isoform X1 n=3 Tax=Salvia hispanica TaxID=49212 RepID=UPI0020090E66|nr:DNA polymerase zeta catalytic subunit isoform X1 [Salvia hispanica]
MGSSQPQLFSVRIVSIDYYMSPPIPDFDISYSNFHGGKVNEVPVIRIYGSTPAGQKTCLHIHQVLPYLYVPISDLGPITNDEADSSMHSVSLSLEKALKLKGNTGSKRQHVHGCNLVRAKKFYGYHSSEELFVKIYFYHPQDVSRAANLLLVGAVLDKNLQPYESHIPFLLQFLIDYNLYGMGHLHVSKMKFRHPVPDVYSHQKLKYSSKLRTSRDDTTCMDFQADSGGDLSLATPVWISSTIPDGWIWKFSNQLSSSAGEVYPVFRRQSTSELEADAVAHDIVNQQFISYVSMSQTPSNTKVVQSLIPIWEEEHAANGVTEVTLLDPEKPLPRDVLRDLLGGAEFEKFIEVLDDSDNCSLLTPESVKSSAVCGDFLDPAAANLEESSYLPSNYLKAVEKDGPLISLSSSLQKFVAAETNETDAAKQLQLSANVEPSTAKDEDALRLLKWLASSQASEDINSDDELTRETILSPLLPSKDIDKVLERANVDYESESQKECQDILDSVDMINNEDQDSIPFQSAEYNDPVKHLWSRVIPQVDGSSDDPPSTPCSGESPKTEYSEAKSNVETQSWSRIASNLRNKHLNKRPQWGSLPVCCQKVSDFSPPSVKEDLGTSLTGNVSDKLPSVKVDKKKDICHSGKASVIAECSTRDLMRRKRSCRVEPVDHRSPVGVRDAKLCSGSDCASRDVYLASRSRSCDENKKALTSRTKSHESNINSSVEVCSEAIHINPSCSPVLGELHGSSCEDGIDAENLLKKGNTKCVNPNYSCSGENLHSTVDSNMNVDESEQAHVSTKKTFGKVLGRTMQLTDIVESCTVPSNSAASETTYNTDCTSERYPTSVSIHKLHNVPTENLKGMERETTDMQFEKLPYFGKGPGMDEAYDSSKDIDQEAETVKLTAMTIPKKPPTIDWKDEGKTEAPLSLQGGSANDLQPFFERNFLEDEQLPCVSPRKSGLVDNHEAVMGVPVLYQNDGSYLYMLTPAMSPPSRQSVDRWLLSDCSDISRHKMDSPPQFLPISDLVEERDSQATDRSIMPESAFMSMCDKRPERTQPPEHNQEIKRKLETSCSLDTSQISGPDKKMRFTPLSQIGFRDPASAGEGQQLTLLSVEVQAESRGELRPDPRFDGINAIILIFQEDNASMSDTYVLLRCDSANLEKDLDAVSESKTCVFQEESQLLNHFTKLIHDFDPDILMGWDVQSSSLGFLAERAAHLGIGLLNNISRTPSRINISSADSRASDKEKDSKSVTGEVVHLENSIIEDEWGRTHASGVHVSGRIVLNVWRLMRNEVKLNMYTVEAVAETVLRRKIPYIPWKVLTRWFASGPGRARYRSIDHTSERAKLNLQILNQLDMINRTSELARVFGIDFFSVLSRGSQYRVESMFLRLAHTQNYLAISPGTQQVASQPAMECIPLVMEPESRFYADPVVVLDFQSLYPSMVIGYNLCFCTCLGKITPPMTHGLGVCAYSPQLNTLRNSKQELLVAPNGVAYVPSKVRRGILPRLLEEILSTRIMVKQAMKKLDPSQLVRHRILNARQLALKLIANVTYGYTAAGFSGRMPCAELADSIVQCGRRTLETAISFVNSNDKWKAKVIYGDTDSMFVLLKGRSVQEAFAIGREIASAITKMNPSPVTLKMEKVYHPCFLLTKKRYVGYSYESPDQSKPIFDAKGIETVRRDTCAAVSKTMEQSLRIYFESQDIYKVKAYVLRQWTKILSGRVSIQDFVFAKEVRLGTYAERAYSLPPAAIVATKSLRKDPRAEPRYAERIPYVVIHGEPGARLMDMVVDPLELLAINSPFRLNDIYYIRKQIMPALQRVFGLVGADLNQWFLDTPRPVRETAGKRQTVAQNPQRMRIDYYYASQHCTICGEVVQGSAHLCHVCSKNETTVAIALAGRTSKLEKNIQHLTAICRHCGGGDWVVESGVKCTSLACSVFYERMKVQKELQSLSEVATATGFYPKCMVEWF